MKLNHQLLIICALATGVSQAAERTLQVGDPGVPFNNQLIAQNHAKWPQMAKWKTAGVRGGIPFVDEQVIRKELSDGANATAINAAIGYAASKGGGAVLLKNGTYNIDESVKMKSNVCLIGESRYGVVCLINERMKKDNAFEFLSGVKNSGIYRLTIRGNWKNKNGERKPFYDWNIKSDKNNELPDNKCISVFFNKSEDCWIDDMDIINSADFPVRSVANHITMRNLNVDGVFNKHGGCHGYFFLLKGYNLVTQCQITHLRHISIQGNGETSVKHDGAEYNVFYDNDLRQELSFHSTDEGNNLIENNRITIPADMPGSQNPNYYAIMGPWSSKHHISENPNYIFKNECIEKNRGHNNATPWSDDSIVYYGPWEVKPQDHHTNFSKTKPGQPGSGLNLPVGGTFYPVLAATTDNNTGANTNNPTTDPVTLNPTADAYVEGTAGQNNAQLKVEANRRTSYLKFNIPESEKTVKKATLTLKVDGDAGSGTISVFKGNSNSWNETGLKKSNAPQKGTQIGQLQGTFRNGNAYSVDLTSVVDGMKGNLTLIAEMKAGGNDVAFGSKESAAKPTLSITYKAEDTATEPDNTNSGSSEDENNTDTTTGGASTSTTTPTEPTGTTEAGLDYAYFEGNWSKLPDFSTLTPAANGTVSNFDLAPRQTNGRFGFVFTGELNVPKTGHYTFYTKSNDGTKLLIGDETIVDNDGRHGARERSGSIELEAGRQPITVEYFNNGGSYMLEVEWKGPSLSKQQIPNNRLFN